MTAFALSLGFSGDRTEHVLWRLNNGNLKKQKNAKLAVVMSGTNNTGHKKQDPAETAQGIEMIVLTIRARCSDAKILLLGVFPRGAQPEHPMRKINVEINKRIVNLADGKRPDLLHPKQKGYEVWAEAIEPTLNKLGIKPMLEEVPAL